MESVVVMIGFSLYQLLIYYPHIDSEFFQAKAFQVNMCNVHTFYLDRAKYTCTCKLKIYQIVFYALKKIPNF